jgi:hypothetical protein
MLENIRENFGKKVFSQSPGKYRKIEEYSNNAFPKKKKSFRKIRKKFLFQKIINIICIYKYA